MPVHVHVKKNAHFKDTQTFLAEERKPFMAGTKTCFINKILVLALVCDAKQQT